MSAPPPIGVRLPPRYDVAKLVWRLADAWVASNPTDGFSNGGATVQGLGAFNPSAEKSQHRIQGNKKPALRAGSCWYIGGAEEDRTPDLCIANAALSQLSYRPMRLMIAGAQGCAKLFSNPLTWEGSRLTGRRGVDGASRSTWQTTAFPESAFPDGVASTARFLRCRVAWPVPRQPSVAV